VTFPGCLRKITVEAALNAELDGHLGYDRHQLSDNDNARNGYSSKTLMSEEGTFEIDVPRDREGSFAPQLVKKHQRRDRYGRQDSSPVRQPEIVASFKEMYDADVSPTLLSKVTDAVIEQVIEWQSRPRAKFWLSVLTKLRNRGVRNILIACVDGLKDFPDAVQATYPKTQIQLRIVHMVRHSTKYVS